jgi:predicted O-linked N-acetylglucosamine transferase (SPINDLY family)
MGADFIDYLIADEVVVPREQQAWYTEKVVYLPDSYQVNDSGRRIAERTPTRKEVGLPERGFVFCSFNNSYKITPQLFDVWMSLLRQVDKSVLWLLDSTATTRRNLWREAAARGIDPQRLVFAPRIATEDHLARHRLADLFVDTLPYNAHTTASEALWAGLPVLTCVGTTFAGRVAASLLRAIGLPELVTGSLDEYESLALRLAREPQALGELRKELARNRAVRPLFDTDRFRRQIEAAYVEMWERNQRGEAPAGFAVTPAA